MTDVIDSAESNFEIDANQTLDSLAHQVLNAALVRIRAGAGSLMVVDHDEQILQVKARLGPPRPARRVERVFRIGEGIAGTVAKTGQAYLCSDVSLEPAFEPSRSGLNFRSLLSVPIIYRGRSVAVINADSESPGQFTPADVERLREVADVVAEPLAQKVGILDALLDVGKDLTQLPRYGGVEIVLKKIAEAAVRALGADVVTVYQYDQARNEFLVEGTGPTIAGRLREPAPMRTRVHPGDVPFYIVRNRQSVFHQDVDSQDFLHHHIERPSAPRPRFVDREGIKSMAALLLPFSGSNSRSAASEEIVGVMFANYRSRHAFNIDERKALATFADFAAIAILNARNDERRIRESTDIVTAVQGSLAHRMSRLWQASNLAIQILSESVPPEDRLAHEHLAIVRQQSERLFSLAKRLQERIKAGETVRGQDAVQLPGTINRVLKTFEPELRRKEIALVNKCDTSVDVRSDDVHLQHVVYDLVRNAIESIDEMRVSYPAHLGQIQVELETSSPDVVEVSIKDNGIGIAEKKHDDVFLPGVSTKNTLGIGLWWSRTFARATGGDLVIRASATEEGAEFALRLPRFQPVARGSTPEPPSILVVEDERYFLQMVMQMFEPLGCRVDSASNLDAARKLLVRNSYDLMVLDLNLDDTEVVLRQEGLRLLDELTHHATQTKVIVMSGHMDRAQLLEIRERHVPVIEAFEKSALDPKTCREIAQRVFREHGKPLRPDAGTAGVER